MWLSVAVPSFSLATARIEVAQVHLHEGVLAPRGQALFDLTVDLSGGVARDCPPVSTCRIILREAAWVRRLCVDAGDVVAQGQALALLSRDPDASPETPAREARVTAATILRHADWWTSEA